MFTTVWNPAEDIVFSHDGWEQWERDETSSVQMKSDSGGIQGDYVSLAPFEEITGRLETLHCDNRIISVALSSGSLRYESDSKEGRTCADALTGKEGAWIAILRTTSTDIPIRVTIREANDHKRTPPEAAVR